MKAEYRSRTYKKQDYEEIRFYQLPKSLIESKQYKDVSLGAKTVYAILRDRQSLSIENDWRDEYGDIFFYYDCRRLSDLCNVSTSTMNRYKKELIKAELLINIRMGQGKPNRMYILKPVSIENTLISQNDYTSVANMTTLDLSKRLHSDTEYTDTENKDTETLQISGKFGYLFFDDLEEEDYIKQINRILETGRSKISNSNYESCMEKITEVVEDETLDNLNKYLRKYEQDKIDNRSVETFVKYLERYRRE